jgi:hypothetical protein
VKPDVPFIFVSGTIGEETAVKSLRSGATDYVLKTNLSRLASAVQRAVQEARERAALRHAEAQVQRSERIFRSFMENLPGVAFIKDAEGRFTFVKPAANGRSAGRTTRSWARDRETWLKAAAEAASGTDCRSARLERCRCARFRPCHAGGPAPLDDGEVSAAAGREDEAAHRRHRDGPHRATRAEERCACATAPSRRASIRC